MSNIFIIPKPKELAIRKYVHIQVPYTLNENTDSLTNPYYWRFTDALTWKTQYFRHACVFMNILGGHMYPHHIRHHINRKRTKEMNLKFCFRIFCADILFRNVHKKICEFFHSNCCQNLKRVPSHEYKWKTNEIINI